MIASTLGACCVWFRGNGVGIVQSSTMKQERELVTRHHTTGHIHHMQVTLHHTPVNGAPSSMQPLTAFQ